MMINSACGVWEYCMIAICNIIVDEKEKHYEAILIRERDATEVLITTAIYMRPMCTSLVAEWPDTI